MKIIDKRRAFPFPCQTADLIPGRIYERDDFTLWLAFKIGHGATYCAVSLCGSRMIDTLSSAFFREVRVTLTIED